MRGVRGDASSGWHSKMTGFLLAEKNARTGARLGRISDSLDGGQRGTMTGRRPLHDISAFQSARAYRKISHMPVGLHNLVYLPGNGKVRQDQGLEFTLHASSDQIFFPLKWHRSDLKHERVSRKKKHVKLNTVTSDPGLLHMWI